jgi:hypothetical protein
MVVSAKVRAWVAFLAIVVGASSCSTSRRSDVTSTTERTLTTSNGLGQNGLTTNGIWSNGIWSNGIWSNGIWSNGIWSNGIWSNGIWSNGIWSNGIWSNGIWSNGIWSNGIWSNGLSGDAAMPGDTLRGNAYARQLLQYVYSCAMPPATYDTTLDPNEGAPLFCTSDADCDTGYACASDNSCVIPLRGAIGVGINADGTSWPASGTCDESCQRWVSACVLARTNAYGVHVQISMRAPADAPQAIKDALRVGDGAGGERESFSLREGAYYGNIFATTPTTPPPAGGNGAATGPIASTPQYYACAGPGSNVPEITKRFCSSQGDQVVIGVPGLCLATGAEAGACAGEDANPLSETRGAIGDCYTTTVAAQQTAPNLYREVITVYLQQPIAVCGNGVCEDDGTSTTPETAATCPSDCHPAGWARSYDAASGIAGFSGHAAVSPNDDAIVLAGMQATSTDVSLGGPVLPAGDGNVIVAKYTRDGAYLWSTRFSLPADDFEFAVAGDGTIAVAGWPQTGIGLVALARLSGTDGHVIGGAPTLLGGAAIQSLSSWVAADADGNIFLAGSYTGMATFATTPPTSFTNTGGVADPDIFVAKVRPDGTPAWAITLGGAGWDIPWVMALAPSGDVLFSTRFGETTASPGTTNLVRLSASPAGAVTPTLIRSADASAGILFEGIAQDDAGEIYTTGYFYGSYDFGPGCGTATATTAGGEFFLVKYAPDGSQCRWVRRAATSCPVGAIYCADAVFQGSSLKFDPAGNLVIGGYLDGVGSANRNAPPGSGAVIDFGAGVFETYRYQDLFVASYSAGGAFRWAKQLPIVLNGAFRGGGVNSLGDVVVSGVYEGSMEVDDRLLVDKSIDASGATFLASFAQPLTSDNTPPVLGAAQDQTGSPLVTVPEDIVAPATSSAGAVVFYMLPTAIDEGNAGTNVACTPEPNTTFPIGTTRVTCAASDPRGNHARPAAFSVTVVDRLGPVFSGVPFVPPVPATGGSGARVTFTPPTATDQVDGPRGVTCTPASGSVFGVGATTVVCASSDAHGNTSRVTFAVSVGDTTAPVLTLPAPITATATSASGANVTYTVTAQDAVDGAVTPVCTPSSGSTFPLGSTTVRCSATDAARNTSSGTFQVRVQLGWGGFQPPIDPGGDSRFALGSTIPVKFKLAGASGGITTLPAKLFVAKLVNGVVGLYAAAEATPPCDGNTFRYDASTKQYVFNLSTKHLSAGRWSLRVDLGDGADHGASISLR